MKFAKHLIIYSVLSARHGFWIALGTPFEALLEVNSDVRAVKLSPRRGFRTSFLDEAIF